MENPVNLFVRIVKLAIFVITFFTFPWIAGALALAIAIRKLVNRIKKNRMNRKNQGFVVNVVIN